MTFSSLFLVPYVVSKRLPVLWLEAIGFAPPGRRESERMVTEKVDAMTQGLLAAQVELVKASFAMGTAVMAGRSPLTPALDGAERMTEAALRPGERKLRRNAVRLARPKR